MCGILGYISNKNNKEELLNGLKLIKHRGPDFQDFYNENTTNLKKHIGLGHTRLSIIDLDERSNQPFISECGNYIIIYNGEIYNHKELKNSFLKNINLKTTSDTEVLLHLYINYNETFLNKLEGMFSFAIYDKKKEHIFCVRDHLGIKPFYYSYQKDNFCFSSEIKPLFQFKFINKKIDKNQIAEFLLNGFIYEPDTGFESIYKLLPGHKLTYSINSKKLNIEEYWSPLNQVNKNKNKTSLKKIFKNSINKHMVSDVPVGLFFSGGVDSSLILANINTKIKSFCLNENSKKHKNTDYINDYNYAQKIASILNKPLSDIKIPSIENKESFLKEIDTIVSYIEEPICDFTFSASYELAKQAQKRNYKVMLSGMGADEIFAGYPRYTLVTLSRILKPFIIIIKKMLSYNHTFSKKIERFNSFFTEKKFIHAYTALIGYFSSKEVSQLLNDDTIQNKFENKINKLLKNKKFSPLKTALLMDFYGYLSHNFTVADKSCMRHGVELRVPFATKKLYEYTTNLSQNELIFLFQTKKPLKKLLKKFIPKKIINRKKTGFNPPLDNIIQQFSKNELMNIFEKSKLFNYVEKNHCYNILDKHFNKKTNNTFKIYQILFLSKWLTAYS